MFRQKDAMPEWTFDVNPTLLLIDMFEAKKVTAVHSQIIEQVTEE